MIQSIVSSKQPGVRLLSEKIRKFSQPAMLWVGIPLQALTAFLDAKNLGKSETEQKTSNSWTPLGIGITNIFIWLAELMFSPCLAIDSLIAGILDFGMVGHKNRDLFNRLHLGQFLTYLGLAVRADDKLESELLTKTTFKDKLQFELQQFISFPKRFVNGIKKSNEWLPSLMKEPLKFLPRISSNLLFMKAFLGPLAGLSLVVSYLFKQSQNNQTIPPDKQFIQSNKFTSTVDDKSSQPALTHLIDNLENFGWFVSKTLYWFMSLSWAAKAFNSDYSVSRRISSAAAGVFEGLHSIFLSNPFMGNFFRSFGRISRTASVYLEQHHQMKRR